MLAEVGLVGHALVLTDGRISLDTTATGPHLRTRLLAELGVDA